MKMKWINLISLIIIYRIFVSSVCCICLKIDKNNLKMSAQKNINVDSDEGKRDSVTG